MKTFQNHDDKKTGKTTNQKVFDINIAIWTPEIFIIILNLKKYNISHH